tara:strand:+ start:29084 stop:30253 length:1170 start_codon:yes stop_codon:yes gene_type:complete
VADTSFRHSEAFLQWIWQNVLFDINSLRTTDGKKLRVIDPGTQNATDGPDFNHAAIEIEGITWHGDVELHIENSGWKSHRHHLDANYNTVVLHVVTNTPEKTVRTKNGHRPHTLNILPHLSPQIHRFLNSFETSGSLNCASGLNFISEEAFYKQLAKAHLEYFDQKGNDFLQFYDPELLPSDAWKQALIISLWDGLGISHNREAMQIIAKSWMHEFRKKGSALTVSETLKLSGLRNNSDKDPGWNFKAVRPANHPKKRITEAVAVSNAILKLPFNTFLNPISVSLWDQLLQEAEIKNTGRYKILFGTVFLPALYMLGNLFAHKKLSESAFSSWKDLNTPVPKSILHSFKSLSLKNQSYQRKLGAVHQLKAYCKPGRCSECFVLKKAIQS